MNKSLPLHISRPESSRSTGKYFFNKPLRFLPRLGFVAAVASSILLGQSAQAVDTTYYWDASGNNANQGGNGTWDTTSLLWDTAATGGTLQAWPNASGATSAANFGGTSGTVTIAAGTTINANALVFTVADYVINGGSSTSILNLNGTTPTITTGAGNTETINVTIAGSGGLTKAADTGTLILGGSNSYTGNTTVQGGTLSLNHANAINSGVIGFSGTSSLVETVANAISGSAGISLPGSGAAVATVTLSAANNFTGAVVLGNNASNVLTLSDTNAIASAASMSVTQGRINLLSNASATFNTPAIAYNNLNINVGNNGSGSNNVIVVSGTMTESNNGGTLTVTGSNGYSLSIPNFSVINSVGRGGVVTANSANVAIGNIINPNASGANSLTLTGSTTGNSVTGVISEGNGATTSIAIGGGGWTFSNANTYSGGTTIRDGTLSVTNSAGSATGTGTVTLTGSAATAHPTLSGTGIISGLVTITGTGASIGAAHLAPGIGAAPGVLTLGNGLTIGNGTNLDYDLGSMSSLVSVTGNLSLGINIVLNPTAISGFALNTTYDLINYTGTLTGNTSTWTASSLPAGATSVTFGTALVGGTNEITVTFNGAVVGATSTTYSITSSATTTKIFTSGSTTISSVITNTGTGTADTLDYTGLGGSATGGTVNGSTTSGTGLANGGGSGTNSGQTYVAGTTSGTFVVNPVGTGTNHTLGTTATLSGSTPVNVSVYDQASLTTSTTTGNQATPANLILTNGTSTGGASGQRAGVTVTGLNASNVQATDNTNNFATPVTTGSAVADAHGTTTSATVGTASVLGKRLNGTYTETITGTTRYTDNTLNGQASVANQTWNITATVSGNASTSRSDVYTANVLSGKAYGTSNSSGFSLGSNLVSSGHQATTATLLNSSLTASATTNANMSFDKTAANAVANSFRSSDILTLSGLNSTSPISGVQLTDTYVLQLSYDTTATGVQYLGWNNGSQFVNAISGDSTGNTTPYLDGNEVVGAYSGQTTVGTYGYDPTTHVVWAVLNHGGITNGSGTLIAGTNEFAAIPEPSTWGMILGGFGMLMGFQRFRKRSVKV